MAEVGRRAVIGAAGAGIVAGIIFGLVEMAATAARSSPISMPLRMFASIIVGSQALQDMPLASMAVLGIVVHLVLSAIFGLIYGLAMRAFPPATRVSYGAQTILGAGYGLLLWLVNFQLIARSAYPWFLSDAQGLQVVLHAVAFGIPLGLQYAGLVRQPPPRVSESIEATRPARGKRATGARRLPPDESRRPPPPKS